MTFFMVGNGAGREFGYNTHRVAAPARCQEVAMGSVAAPRVVAALFAGFVAIASGCDGKDGDGASGEGEDKVPDLTAAEFYKDYSSLKGADRLNKYGEGVAIKGKVEKRVYLGEDEGLQLWLSVDGPGHIAARFQDGGAAARQRKVKVGDTIAIRCQFNGKPDDVLFLVDCALL
jgi:tRNA_anti-like